MPPGQVSVWVPLVVALIGFVGLLVNQLIVARRENAKLKLETERDKNRLVWDVRKEWREQRMTCYASFLSDTNRMMAQLEPIINGREPSPHAAKTITELSWAIGHSVSTIQLLGSKPAVELAKEVAAYLATLRVWCVDTRDEVSPDMLAGLRQMAADVDRIRRSDLLEVFRQDIGADHQ